jgi:hypothetical protein
MYAEWRIPATAASGNSCCKPMKRAFLFFAAVLGSLTVAAVRADADSVDTLQVNSTFIVKFAPIACSAGIPATTSCHSQISIRSDLFPGLGAVTTSYTLILDNFGTTCTSVHAETIPIVVAGKGTINLKTSIPTCVTADQLASRFPPLEFTVIGGSGRYAGASGSGVLNFQNTITNPETGFSSQTLTGTLNVPGLAFDLTPPVFTGATSKVVKTRLAKGARVSYLVKATDATDGIVPSACLPKSGSLFDVGRTTVSCNPTDSSGNTTTARFVITVKRVRR